MLWSHGEKRRGVKLIGMSSEGSGIMRNLLMSAIRFWHESHSACLRGSHWQLHIVVLYEMDDIVIQLDMNNILIRPLSDLKNFNLISI